MTDLRWVLAAVALVACGGRSVGDGPAAAGGESAGGSTSFAGASSGGPSTGGASPVGGASNGGSATCLNGGKPAASHTMFSFETNEALWIRRTCDIEYTVSKLCGAEAVPLHTQGDCAQPCDGADNGCESCPACPEDALRIGYLEQGEVTVLAAWDGY